MSSTSCILFTVCSVYIGCVSNVGVIPISTLKSLPHFSHLNVSSTLGNKLVVLKDIDNYIIVEDEEVLLVYPRGDEQGIKEVRNLAKEKFGEDLI